MAINIIKSGFVTETIKLPDKGPLLAIVFLAIPLFDSLRVFIVRASQKKNPLLPGKGHIHHVLLDLGFSHRTTSLILCLTSLLIIVFSYYLLFINVNIGITIIALISYTLLFFPFYVLRKRLRQ